MTEQIVPEPFSPGEAIREELGARHWLQTDLAEIMGVSNKAVSDLISGKKRINAETAQALADAFGSLAEEWMRLQSMYELAIKAVTPSDVRMRKSQLYHMAPIGEMIKRGWLEGTQSIGFLEAQVDQFYRSDYKNFACAARKSTDHESVTVEQLAWFRRATNLAESLAIMTEYDPRQFEDLCKELIPLRTAPELVGTVPKILTTYGIRFLIIEPLPGSKIDGVTFWINGAEPVIALSMRYDRIDWFWFTLAHELAHMRFEHGKEHAYIDTLLVGANAQAYKDKKQEERDADEFASDFLIDESKLAKFVETVSPLYSNAAIRGFAKLLSVHPGIVVGRLQHMNKIAYNRGRDMLVKVRKTIVESAITDGWDCTVTI